MYKATIWNHEINIEAGNTVFSPHSLDNGTALMLKQITLQPDDKVLDLGCGTGVVGIAVAKEIGMQNVTLSDIDQAALQCAMNNAGLNGVTGLTILESDGFSRIIDNDFSLILSNPPYHTDFAVARQFIEEGKKHLRLGGKMVLVVKRLEWYKNKMTTVFGGVKVVSADDYHVIISEKRDLQKKSVKVDKPVNKKHQKKQARSAKFKKEE